MLDWLRGRSFCQHFAPYGDLQWTLLLAWKVSRRCAAFSRGVPRVSLDGTWSAAVIPTQLRDVWSSAVAFKLFDLDEDGQVSIDDLTKVRSHAEVTCPCFGLACFGMRCMPDIGDVGDWRLYETV